MESGTYGSVTIWLIEGIVHDLIYSSKCGSLLF
jgi:hypothetical protein